MRRFFIKNRIPGLLTILILGFVVCILLQFTFPETSKASTSYQSLNCPTAIPGNSTLQMVPCTPSSSSGTSPSVFAPSSSSETSPSVIAPSGSNETNPSVIAPSTQNSQPSTVSSPSVSNAASSPGATSGTGTSGPVCTPDSTIANGSTCNCQSDLEPDAVCSVASLSVCSENGGISGSDLIAIGSGLGGAPMTSAPASTNGSVQCLWLDTEPVPAAAHATNCSIECNSKPVLYFYSPTTISLNVRLDIPGVVTASNPHYPANGWQNVSVHPAGTADGTLKYNNNFYKELYYEDATIKAQAPTQGFVIKTTDLSSSLRLYTAKLGLNTNEQNEFLAYWVPRLTSLQSPYIFFSIFNPTQKKLVDDVDVTPSPTTTIAFLAYFKALPAPIQVTPLQFPSVPKRQGLTMVEWGGTIASN